MFNFHPVGQVNDQFVDLLIMSGFLSNRRIIFRTEKCEQKTEKRSQIQEPPPPPPIFLKRARAQSIDDEVLPVEAFHCKNCGMKFFFSRALEYHEEKCENTGIVWMVEGRGKLFTGEKTDLGEVESNHQQVAAIQMALRDVIPVPVLPKSVASIKERVLPGAERVGESGRPKDVPGLM